MVALETVGVICSAVNRSDTAISNATAIFVIASITGFFVTPSI